MSAPSQREIIQEQIKANERIIRSVEYPQARKVEGQIPVNERVKYIQPADRAEVKPQPSPSKPSDDKPKS